MSGGQDAIVKAILAALNTGNAATTPGGPKPGVPFTGLGSNTMPTFHPQDQAMLQHLQKRFKLEGDVTVAASPEGWQFILPSGKAIDTPSTFQLRNGGAARWRGKSYPIINLPINNGTVN